MMENEEVLFQGRPSWRAWAGLWIWGWILLPVLIGGVLLLMVEARKRQVAWKITSRRIEVERGWLSKQVDTLELWRIRDVEFNQSLTDRMFGVSRLTITAHDGQSPVMDVRGLPADRALYDRLMSAVMNARQQRGVLNLNP